MSHGQKLQIVELIVAVEQCFARAACRHFYFIAAHLTINPKCRMHSWQNLKRNIPVTAQKGSEENWH
jgi:hypothetical protein